METLHTTKKDKLSIRKISKFLIDIMNVDNIVRYTDGSTSVEYNEFVFIISKIRGNVLAKRSGLTVSSNVNHAVIDNLHEHIISLYTKDDLLHDIRHMMRTNKLNKLKYK